MSIFSNVTEQNLINLRKLADQQRNQRAEKIKNRFLKQTHDVKLAESLSRISKRLEEVNKSTKELGEIVKESKPETPQVAIANTQTPAIEKTTTSQSLLDTLSFMKTSKHFFKIERDGNKLFWNKIPINALGENRISIKDREYDIKHNIQTYFTNTNQTTKYMNDEDKSTVFDILRNTGFYSTKHKKGLKSARMQDALYNLPREIAKIRNPPLPAIENESDNLQGEGVEKIIIPSNKIDIYTRLEILLGLKLSGHTDTLTEASNLIDELYNRGELQKNNNIEMLLLNSYNKTCIYLSIITIIQVLILAYTYKYKYLISNKWRLLVNYYNKKFIILDLK